MIAAAVVLACVVLQSPGYASEWARAKQLVDWTGRAAGPDMVRACPYIALDAPNLDRLWGTTDWTPTLDKRGRMRVEESVTTFVPEGGEALSLTLTHEFIHVLLVRLQHVEDPRGDVGDEEEFICRVLPEDCAYD